MGIIPQKTVERAFNNASPPLLAAASTLIEEKFDEELSPASRKKSEAAGEMGLMKKRTRFLAVENIEGTGLHKQVSITSLSTQSKRLKRSITRHEPKEKTPKHQALPEQPLLQNRKTLKMPEISTQPLVDRQKTDETLNQGSKHSNEPLKKRRHTLRVGKNEEIIQQIKNLMNSQTS